MHCFFIAVFLVTGQLLTYNGATANAVIEIYVAIDQKVIKNYLYINPDCTVEEAKDDARRDAEYFLTEVNKQMQATGRGIEIRVRRMDILEQDVFNDCHLTDGNKIHEDLGLQTFTSYLKGQGLFNSLNYDMALLWTGYNIYAQSDSTLGYATVGNICAEKAVTIVEYDLTYHTVHVTVHEIGHVLGLDHDEGGCNRGYIMSPSTTTSPLRFSFSPCSLQTLSELIPGKACLKVTNSESQIPQQTVGDDLLDVDIVCQRARNNTKSRICTSDNLYNGNPPQGDIVCERIYCRIPDTTICSTTYPTNGMICGVDDRCSNGKCVTAPDDFPTPAGLKALCLYGGDKSTQCVNYTRDQICPQYKDTFCCGYCSNWSRKRSAEDYRNPISLNATKLDILLMPDKMEKENKTDEDPKTTE